MIATRTFKIQSKTDVSDGIGGVTSTWSDTLSVDGYIDMSTGTDNNTIQDAFLEQSTHVLIVPTFTPGITDQMRVVDDVNRWYSITYVDDPVGQHHHLEVYLKLGGVVSG